MTKGNPGVSTSAGVEREMDSPGDVVLPRLVPMFVLLLTTALLYPTTEALRLIWLELTDAGYEHGPLLGLVAFVLLFQVAPPRFQYRPAQWPLIALLGVGSIAWTFAVATSTLSASLALWPVISWLALAAIYGVRGSVRFILPLGLLYFALPVWGPLTNLLLWPLTVFVASQVVELIGINAYIDGNMVFIPAGSFEIVSGCSGQQFFLVSCVIALLIGHLNSLRVKSFAFIVMIAVLVALVSNWLRVIAIIVIGYVSEMRHPLVAEGHLAFGWGLFAVAILAFCIWARAYLQSRPDSAFSDGVNSEQPSLRSSKSIGMAVASAIALLVGPTWLAVADVWASKSSSARPLSYPADVQGLVGPFAGLSPLSPIFSKPESEKAVAYSRVDPAQSGIVFVYANRYLRQSQGAELVGYGTEWFPANRWRQVGPVSEQLGGTGSLGSSFATVRAKSFDGRDWLVRYAYAFEHRTVGNAIIAKLVAGTRLLTLQSGRAGAIMVAVECDRQCTNGTALLESAWETLVPNILPNYGG